MTPDALAALHATCFTTPRPWSAAEFAGFLATPGVFLCQKGAGFLLARIAGPEVEILTLAVHPKARRQGIARTLLAELATTAGAKGAKQAFLEVATDNPAAIALYRACGYGESGIRRDYYSSPRGLKVSAYVMSRQLEPAP